jgi:hypothetical protein
VAVLLWLPNLIWQATHGWPQLELSEDIRAEYSVAGERIFYVLLQVVMFSPLTTVFWVAGLVFLLRRSRWDWARPVGVAYVVLFVLFAVVGGKGYYLAGLMPALIAAGVVGLLEVWPRRRVVLLGAASAVLGIAFWPAALPLLPADTFGRSFYASVVEEPLETIGWEPFTDQVNAVVESIPAGQRADAVIFTGNYGEAGALEFYGSPADVYSGHNGFGDWGPPPESAAPVVVVGYRDPTASFVGCDQAAVVDNGLDVDNEEQGASIWLCDGPRGGWAAAWSDLTHLSGSGPRGRCGWRRAHGRPAAGWQ